MGRVITLVVFWLIVVNVFALAALNRFNLKPDTAYTWINPFQFRQEQSWDLLSIRSHWDSFWYLDIAKNGYSYKGPEELSNLVFFPLYPALIRLVSFLIGGNWVLAGWVISSASLVLAAIFLFKLVKKFHPHLNPYFPLVLLLIFPTAFFLNAVYSEALFLFLSVAAFYFALEKNFLLAGTFGLLAVLTRATGALLFIPIAWEYFESYRLKGIFSPRFLPIFLIPLGMLSFFAYHYQKFHDPLLFSKVEGWWGRAFATNRNHLALLTHPAVVNLSLDLFFIVFALISTAFIFKRLRISYGLYLLSALIFTLSSGTTMSIGRYIMVLFPLYIFGASVKNELVKQIWIFVSVLFLGLYITLFVNNYWAG